MKIIEYQRNDENNKYTIRYMKFRSFKQFLSYTMTMQKHCAACNVHANYYELKKDKLEKILYISNKGLYCTL